MLRCGARLDREIDLSIAFRNSPGECAAEQPAKFHDQRVIMRTQYVWWEVATTRGGHHDHRQSSGVERVRGPAGPARVGREPVRSGAGGIAAGRRRSTRGRGRLLASGAGGRPAPVSYRRCLIGPVLFSCWQPASWWAALGGLCLLNGPCLLSGPCLLVGPAFVRDPVCAGPFSPRPAGPCVGSYALGSAASRQFAADHAVQRSLPRSPLFGGEPPRNPTAAGSGASAGVRAPGKPCTPRRSAARPPVS